MYKTRATSLESFYVCPKKYYEVPREESDDMTIRMYIWDIGHMAHQSIIITKKVKDYFFQTVLKEMWKIDNITWDKIDEVLELVKHRQEKYKDREKIFETKLSCIISKTFITWTPDVILEKDWIYEIHDFKIVANASYYEEREYRLQPYLYWYMVCDIMWLNEIDFKYIIYEKKSKPITKEILYKINKQETKEKLEKIIEDFEIAECIWYYEPRKNTFCRWCPFYKDGTCPAYKVE